ncbi:hypothetical protein HK405_015133 [Cladochytrium tenue]|nr:hypothetical protein HK405_015133 [Cladochytrium tenue]
MGIYMFMNQIPASKIDDFLEDESKLHEHLKLPYKNYLDYWKNREPEAPATASTHDLDKAWTGTQLNDELLNYYFPARILSPAQITVYVAFLQTIDEPTLKARFNPRDMADKAVDFEEPLMSPDMWEYLWNHFLSLRDFLQRTAEKGDLGIVVRVS